MIRFIVSLILISVILTGVPLAGTWWQDQPFAPHLVLPHITEKVDHAPISWPVWIGMATFVLCLIAPYLRSLSRSFRADSTDKPTERPFPWWGKAGVLLIIVSWFLAWSRFAWFEALQPFTFTPLWCGYILTINALTTRRKGNCLLTGQPRYVISLFLLSAIFWWYYEYLNTWINNWFYVGTDQLTSTQIIVHSSLAYATVLPAVIGTTEWLATYPLLNNACRDLWQVRLQHSSLWASVSVTGGSLALLLVTSYAETLFPLIWFSPMFVAIGIHYLLTKTSVFTRLAAGNWCPVILPSLAAMVCGFFWELWNFRSFAHWEYSIPYVHVLHIFEMPLLGYAGYLPFGLTCLAVASLLPGGRRILDKQVLSG